jgi:hypothetical protein
VRDFGTGKLCDSYAGFAGARHGAHFLKAAVVEFRQPVFIARRRNLPSSLLKNLEMESFLILAGRC